MSDKPFAIVTAADGHCDDFLLRDWLPSALDHIDREQIDLIVLDYGLSPSHRRQAERQDVRLVPCVKDGFVANLRLRDVVRLLDATPYRKLLLCDAGDVIFQTDVRRIFDDDVSGDLAVVSEEFHTPFYEMVADYDDVRPEALREMLDYVQERPILNIGVVCGTAQTFRELWREYERRCRDVQCYGSDQLVFNYFAYRRGFRALDVRYNFIPLTARHPFRVRRGVFYDEQGRVIPIVHNAGGNSFFRAVSHFGYGPDRNRPRRLRSAMLHGIFYLMSAWNAVRRRLPLGSSVKKLGSA